MKHRRGAAAGVSWLAGLLLEFAPVWVLSPVLALALASCVGGGAGPTPGEAGAAPRVGDRYTNEQPAPPSAGPLIQAGLWARKIWTTVVPRAGAAARVGFDPSAIDTARNITWIGHASWLVRMDGATILTDPIFSDWAAPMPWTGPRRAVPPGITLGQLPKVDVVVISHDHYDHADEKSIRALAQMGCTFVVPLGMAAWIEALGGRAVERDWWQHVDIAGIRITSVPAQHGSGRSLSDSGQRLWSGWYLRGPTGSVYHAGDTGHSPALAEIGRRLGSPEIALVPIGAYDTPAPGPHFHTNPEEAIRLGLALGAVHIVAMHFGTFDLSDEPMDEPPRRFTAEGERLRLPGWRLWLLKVGETRRW